MRSSYGIAVFHNIGDILLCTPIARQLKADNPDCEVIWYTSKKYKFILENNPFIDQIVSFDGDPLMLDKSIQELKSRRQWTQFFTPAAHMNYDKMVDGSLPELVKSSVDFEWTVPFVPVLRLSETEKARAAAYWDGLPSGRKILIETEFDSQQSPLTEEYIDKLFEIFSSISPVFIFTAKNKPAYFDKFKNKYSNVFWCQEEFRLNAEFYNLCDAFVGVSSGISCLSNSDYCRNDVPHLEISRGYHWSNAPYFSRKKELYVSYSQARYVDGLHWLLNKLTNSAAEHCFSPRFISSSHVYGTKEIVACSLCGAAGYTVVRGQDIVRCNECGNIYLRARMTKSSMEKYYSEVYAVNQPAAAAPVRVPRSKEEIDLLPEFIGAQRRGVLAEIQSLLKVDLAGKVLIDIGCGWGAFLHHARNQGMKVMGFEFTNPNVEFGRNALNIDIRRQQFIDADDIKENSVDIIVMNHSLEHVPYPFEFLEKIEYVLKPGGIFFGMVPNFESICSKVLLEKWAWIEPDWHYTHFTPKTLKETLAQTGFYIEKLYTTSGDYGDDIPISILKKIKPGLYEPNYRQHLKEFQKHGRGEQINVIAVKRGSSKGRIRAPKNSLTPVSRPVAGEIDSVKHIIWLRTDSIGDAVLSSSMLSPLRKKYPAASITVVCQEHITELYEACDAVDRIVTIPTEHRWKDQRHYDEFLDTIRALNPDLLINSVYSVHGLSDLKGLEFIPERIAIRQSSQATYTRLIPISSEIKSELQRHLAFLHGLGIVCESLETSTWITQADRDYADVVFREYGLDSKNTIAFFAGTRTENRIYEGYADALRPIVERLGCSVIALGGAAEHAINQVQLDALKTKTVNLCGQVTLRQSAAILSRCRIAFGAETGLAHIAAAVGVPHVILIGGGHFGRFMPYSPLTSLVCLPLNCYGCDWSCRYKQVRCIRGVKPYVITRALEDCMSGSSDKTRIYLQNRVPSEYDNHLLASEAIGAFANPDKVSLIYVCDSQENRDSHIQGGSCDISIVLATKDRAKLLDNMLSSLKEAVEGISYEIIVIEGGSSDNTPDVLRKHNITQIYNEKECLGPGRHSWPQLYNFGFSKARGKWAMFASDDITFSENCVSKALGILNKQNEDVAGGIFYYKNLCYTEPQWADFGIDFTYGPKLLMNYGLLKLDYFRQFGGFDEAYHFYCADGDLCLKLYEKGKQLIPLPGCFIIHNNVLDVQKKENFRASNPDIELYLKRWLHFVPTHQLPNPRRLMWKQNLLEQSNIDNLKSGSDNEKIRPNTSENIVQELHKKGLLHANQPLRLHLGCGERRLKGYINIDFPPSEHTVQASSGADVYSDITKLNLAGQSVDEIRLHHLFEHFDIATAIALLCKWHQWLKKDGIICIETPDVEVSSGLISGKDLSYKQKQSVLRHIFGSHEAPWAIHKDGWYEAKFKHVLGSLGFKDINFSRSVWQMTHNITVTAQKAESVDTQVLCVTAKKLLRDGMVDEAASEEKLWAVWCKKFDEIFSVAGPQQSQVVDTKRTPVVSIFMSVLNGEKYLGDTIESILNQTYRDFEFVIVDDGSTDRTFDIAQSYQGRDARIKVVRSPHKGVVGARNNAIEHTDPRSRYLMNHDGDDISLPGKLEKLVQYLDEHPEVAIVGCFAEYFDDAGNNRGQPALEWQVGKIRQTFGRVNSMIHSASLIRREVLDKIDLYREDYVPAEDYDLFARALLAGFNLANIPEILHKIRLHSASIGSMLAKQIEDSVQGIRKYYLAQYQKKEVSESRGRPQKFSGSNGPLDILHTVEFYYPHTGGAESVVQQLSERLVKRGHKVTVASTKLPERKVRELNGVEIREFDLSGALARGFSGGDIDRYREFLLKHPADVMMNYAAQQWATDLAFETLDSTMDRRVNIIAPCGYSALEDACTLKVLKFKDYFTETIPTYLPKYDAAIYHSAGYQDYQFAQNHNFTNSIVIPNGVCEQEFSQAPGIDFRRKFDITTKYLGICVANFYPGKGQDKLIECVRQMNRPDFTMVLIGKQGEELPKLRQLSAGFNIRFCIGIERQDILAAYHQADIFLFASEKECSPLVILEAKASRLPFVSTDCGNVREWTGGIVCPPEKMAAYANRILNDDEIRKNLAEEGFRQWKEKFTWESVVDRYEELYLTLHHKKTVADNSAKRIASCSVNPQLEPASSQKSVASLIFSKDRAMQLQATIESFNLHCRDNDTANIVVLFKASNLVHKQQYDELKKKFPVVAFVEETDFRKQVLSLIERCKYVLFLVDDNIFVKPFSLKDITAALDAEKRAIGFSLRLGKNTGYCYMLNSNQKLPAFESVHKGILKYNWPGAECDFGYPLDVSSSVYRSDEILGLLGQLAYSNPNTLEHGMSKNVRMFVSSAPALLVFEESVAFCNPVNMVQRVYENNKFGRTHKYAPEQLAEGFSCGMAIDVQKYAGFTPNSAHQEVELYFKGVTTTGVKLRALDGDKTSKPKFSVVMANYNNGRYIAQAIESVLGQTFKDWELIIVDDCSTDDSIDIINRFVKDNRIRLICHDTNEGYVASLKTGIAAVKGELFGVLDSDDCLTAGAVETMYQQHVKFPDCGLIYSQFMCCDDNLTPTKPGYCRDMPPGKTTLDIDVVSHFKTFKLADYLKTPGYDESILYAEDRDIIHKMEEVTQLKFVDECLYLYREVSGSQSHNARKKAIGIMSRERAKTAARMRRRKNVRIYQPKDNSLVSIWMAAYNAADYIAKAIESVLLQNYRNFELIVVDDGSTDNTADIVNGFKNESIKYFFKKNGGASSARNLALQKSGGSFVVVLDSDDMITPDFLAKHLEMFEKYPESDMIYCDDCLIDENDKPIRIIDRPEYPNQNALISDIFRCGFPVVPFRTCIRKSVFDKIGLYDERLLVAEDYDMLRRFVSHGLRMCHLSMPLYLRRVNTASISRNFDAAKAKSQFEAIRRFTETFKTEQLFPDVQWGKLPAEQKLLLAKCRAALVYLGIGQDYQQTNAQDYAQAGFDMACEQLDECCKIEPANQQVRNMREKCQSIRDKRVSNAGKNIYQQV
jgi:glycosyltransferase involved in cell wall biosynthesis/ADP-heptose:LPS heptosyltransferase/2-polyprenyl-3-methyl-5-hydroxy-6-metoxy-1,4-benzoquinol methylase